LRKNKMMTPRSKSSGWSMQVVLSKGAYRSFWRQQAVAAREPGRSLVYKIIPYRALTDSITYATKQRLDLGSQRSATSLSTTKCTPVIRPDHRAGYTFRPTHITGYTSQATLPKLNDMVHRALQVSETNSFETNLFLGLAQHIKIRNDRPYT